MAAPLSSSSWIAEDDFLLKNAVEAGACLEALAKGAVRFSRKFTLQELEERWYSLLYDPVISAEASARMLEFERSASNNLLKSLGSCVSVDNAEVPPKRKVESVRGMYHALRKRTCIRPSNSSNQSFLGSAHLSDGFRDGTGSLEHVKPRNETPVGSSMLGVCTQNHYEFPDMDLDFLHHEQHHNNLIRESIEYDIFEQENVREDSAHILGKTLVDFGNSQAVEGMGPSRALPESGASYHSLEYSSPQPRTPLWKAIEVVSAPAMPISMSHGDRGQGSKETFMLPDDLAHLSDSLLNFGNENDLGFTDADREGTTKKSCHVNIESILLSSPNGVRGDDVPDVKEPQKRLTVPDGSCHPVLKDIGNKSHSSQGNQHCIRSSEVNEPSSTSIPKLQSHELLDVEMVCVLNTEDQEIPCNDDFVPGKVVTTSALQTSYKEASHPASTFANRKDSGQKLSMLRKEDNPAQHFPGSQMGGPVMFGGIGHEHPVFSSGVKTKSLDVHCLAGISRQVSSAHADPNHCRSSFATPKSVTHGLKEKSLYASFGTDCPLHQISSSTSDAFPRPESNPSTGGQKASLEQEISESDDDIPNFDDIESLILGMDLCPDDPDPRFSIEMSRYQHEDTKRTIMRLEQCARSSTQRAIAYQGAFAVFYGRYLKHYIKETEVILGRATDEVAVDIDLGREGRATKISRRQALIKMDGDGSFILKNLGKSSVFLNGQEIATGQGVRLRSGNLIEKMVCMQIKEMAFVFEVNENAVKRYLEKVANRNKGKDVKFEWSEERVM
ncbi:hypothetical protein Dsin_011272 [Dipteronia sinensis]|uniref:FHA domain-containing protein n=1 Tax=Dipteronia sinensis TaxID=43782 RepID=A0AAE0AVA9_9ROSI|nr:hypothetical protein Dsin_011272 [Dipteronia sinensis]